MIINLEKEQASLRSRISSIEKAKSLEVDRDEFRRIMGMEKSHR